METVGGTMVRRRTTGAAMRRLNVYLPRDVIAALEHRAIDEDLSASALVEKAVREYLARVEREKGGRA